MTHGLSGDSVFYQKALETLAVNYSDLVTLAILAVTCIIMVFVLRSRSRSAMLTTTAAQPQGINVEALRHVHEETEEQDE